MRASLLGPCFATPRIDNLVGGLCCTLCCGGVVLAIVAIAVSIFAVNRDYPGRRTAGLGGTFTASSSCAYTCGYHGDGHSGGHHGAGHHDSGHSDAGHSDGGHDSGCGGCGSSCSGCGSSTH
ncbi:hypothetical protein [Fodinicola acaciae]|uniref:hypothetical protein n=1 Tax=Fodinicola acaciae TaxID=2681555 RepID=UPI0013D34520|nr:hypothetical protein [Fodinicola acaciae]